MEDKRQENQTNQPTLRERVEMVVKKLRPYLQADGGDIQLIDVTEDGIVKVQLLGMCGGCAFSQITLQNTIEASIKKEVPEIKSVIGV